MTATNPTGNSVDLTDISLYLSRREHAVFKTLRANDPVHLNHAADGNVFYALTRHAHISEVARDPVRFINSKGTQIADKRAEGKGAVSVHNADGLVHRELRRIGQAALNRRLVESRRARMHEVIADLIDRLPRNAPFDFVEEIAVKIPMIIFSELLGVPRDMQETLVGWANTMSDVRATNEEQAQNRTNLFDYFRTLAAEKRRSPGDDIASSLVQAQFEKAPIEQDYLDAFFMVLTVAGNETTRFLLAGGLEALLETPDQFDALRADAALITPAVEEMARWVTPVVQMRRTTTEDLDLFGTPVPKDTKVVLYFASANRDEDVFGPTADQFRVARSPNHHMGFGHGNHFCLGAHIGRMETQIFWEEFLKRDLKVALHPGTGRLPSNWFAGLTRLNVELSE